MQVKSGVLIRVDTSATGHAPCHISLVPRSGLDYGDLAHLDAATVDEVRTFFKTYYAPNNAALVVTGDFAPEQVKAWIEKYFGNVPAARLPPTPDLKEPRQEKEKRAGRTDPLANRPALGIAYHVPDRFTPESRRPSSRRSPSGRSDGASGQCDAQTRRRRSQAVRWSAGANGRLVR